MILSKPKSATLFSLSLFIILVIGIGFWSWINIPASPTAWILAPIVCLALALAVSMKMLIGYRVVVIKDGRWRVKRLINRDIIFKDKDIEWWKEIVINTAGGIYKQLHVHAGKGNDAKVSLQEHTGYQKILNMLKIKHRQKEIIEPGNPSE